MRLFMAVGGVVVGYIVYKAVTEGAEKAANAVNPFNPENVANRAASGIVETVSGGRFLSVGDALFRLFNPNAPGEKGSL